MLKIVFHTFMVSVVIYLSSVCFGESFDLEEFGAVFFTIFVIYAPLNKLNKLSSDFKNTSDKFKSDNKEYIEKLLNKPKNELSISETEWLRNHGICKNTDIYDIF